MANPNPDMSGLTPFQPGNNANPSGKSSAQRKLEIENAERATRIRAKLLEQLEAKIESLPPEQVTDSIRADILRMLKDSEDRGLGTPAQSIDHRSSDGTMTPQAVVYQLPDNGRD